MLNTVFIAGYGNSTEGHWQHSWHMGIKNSNWVEQSDWDHPNCTDWVECLNELIQTIDGPILLASHSLGGSTIVEWSKKYSANIFGAFMVAVPDVESENIPNEITGYQTPALEKLPFPSMVLASTNNPYSTLDRTSYFSQAWGSAQTIVGNLEQVNADSNIGDWPEGLNLLNEFIKSIDSSKSLPL
jgi:predicted alpha/beta hydrolase family esterase